MLRAHPNENSSDSIRNVAKRHFFIETVFSGNLSFILLMKKNESPPRRNIVQCVGSLLCIMRHNISMHIYALPPIKKIIAALKRFIVFRIFITVMQIIFTVIVCTLE